MSTTTTTAAIGFIYAHMCTDPAIIPAGVQLQVLCANASESTAVPLGRAARLHAAGGSHGSMRVFRRLA